MLRDHILPASHYEPSSGHLGVTRTLLRTRQSYFWPHLRQDVKQYVRTCRDCQGRKTALVGPTGLLHPIDPPLSSFQRVSGRVSELAVSAVVTAGLPLLRTIVRST